MCQPKRVGLALGGGAVRGAAHVSVLQVLEPEAIVPSVIAGMSAGVIVGACYAAGVTSAEMSRLFESMRWPKLARLSWRRSLGFFDTEPLEAIVQAGIGVPTFDELPRRFAAVACDIMPGQRVVLETG